MAAVTHARLIDQEIAQIQSLDDHGLDLATEKIMSVTVFLLALEAFLARTT